MGRKFGKKVFSLGDIFTFRSKKINKTSKTKNILFEYTPDVVKFIASKGHSDKFGARPLRRAIQTYIEDILAVGFTKNEIKELSQHIAKLKEMGNRMKY